MKGSYIANCDLFFEICNLWELIIVWDLFVFNVYRMVSKFKSYLYTYSFRILRLNTDVTTTIFWENTSENKETKYFLCRKCHT